MKKSILIMTAFTIITGAILTSCNTPAKKVDSAQDNVIEAKEDLVDAKEEYLVEIENYRKETALRIKANNQSIVDFNKKIENEKNDAKAEYEKQIAALEQKNNNLEKRLDNYKVDGEDNWIVFKTEFNNDMDKLGQAFKDLTVKNVN